MRPLYAFALVALVVAGTVVLERSTRFAPGPEVEILALTTEPVRVSLDFSPTEAEVYDAMVAALEEAALREEQPAVATELEAIVSDDDFLTDVARRTSDRLGRDAAALAFSSTAVGGTGDRITVVGITIEMLPRGHHDGISRAHEDGHATINNGIIELCTRAIVQFEVGDGKSGQGLVEAINDHIELLEGRAHAQYHVDVSDGVFGSHPQAAARALDAIERAGCLAY